jgi:hypothetical protein
MATIGKVSAVFTASTAGLTSGVNNASSAFKSLQGDISGLRGGMSALVAINAAQFFGSLVNSAASAVGSMVRMGQAQAEVIDQTSKLAARLGMTYGELSGLALAGDLAGVSLDAIGTAATKADVAFVRATQGSATAAKAFANLGLNVEQLSGLNAADRFDAIASAIAAIPGEAERSAAAVQIFGRAGAQLLPLFAGGADAIAAAREEAERFGLSLTTAQGQDVEAMNDAFTRAQKAVEGVVQQVVAYLSPAVKAVADTFSNLVGSIGGANIGQAIGDGILQGARFLAGVGDFIIANFGSTFDYLSQVGQQWGAVLGFGQSVANLFYGAFKVFETVGNVIGGLFSDIVAGLYGVAADLAAVVPGFGSMATELRASADSWSGQADTFAVAMNQNADAAAAAFSAAFSDNSTPVGLAIAGPLTTALDSAIAQAQASANQIEQVKAAPVDVMQTVSVEVSGTNEAIKGIDSRSKEGIAEMFRLMRGQGADVQQQQLSVLEQIRENTAAGDDTYPFPLD